MDFYQIKEGSLKKDVTEIYPDFKVCRSKDLMVRGKSFYAVWDEEKGLWSTDEYDVQRLVDAELLEYKEKRKDYIEGKIKVKTLGAFSNTSWTQFKRYMSLLSDNSHQLDERLTFSNTEVKKKDYVSRRLPYPLEEGSIDAYTEMIGTLYDPEEREKLEWAVGAIVAGDAKDIQKFLVLYGEAGSGKSTFLNIIQKLFAGYYTAFEAKALTSNSNAFSTEVFKNNPLVAIQHDGDLSKIEDNTKLNSIISHEEMTMNEKYKASYMARSNSFLFMATNKPVKITDAKSGIIRRLIDVKPSGRKVPTRKYHALMSQIDFELGAIAYHCLEVYRTLGKNYYSAYRPLEMMMQTDVFFNFIEDNYLVFKKQDGVTLTQAYDMYKTYCEEALIEFKLPRYKFREELRNYFKTYIEDTHVDGKHVRGYYSEFLYGKFVSESKTIEEKPVSLELSHDESLLDVEFANCPAQYANEKGTPIARWAEVESVLSDLDTRRLHYVLPPINHIFIDFDLKDKDGNKSLEKNIEAASKWPSTYAEFSQGGCGIHLHYIYDGDVTRLSTLFSEGIEVKAPIGKSSLRRRLSKCNNIPIATINSGLPLKGEKVLNFEGVTNENIMRDTIKRALAKEFSGGATRTNVDFIFKVLDDAYKAGVHYDLRDMEQKVLIFANNSTNQSRYCVELVNKMKFKSEEASQPLNVYEKDELVFFDVEVFPNLFLVNWKYSGPDSKCVRMINPTSQDIEGLMRMKLVGFNCRRYDNHILYGRYIGYDNMQLFQLSQKIVGNTRTGLFGEAYNISYTDVYDFSSVKQSLKKFEIDLGIHHMELGLPWDQPVPEEKWLLVADYCDNDVIATEAVFNARKEDWTARQILADLSGLTPNDTTQQHTARIIFGEDKNPQNKFEYTDLSKLFPGYVFDMGKSMYKEEDPGEGGYVYAEPGMYSDVALLDVVSMHPTSLVLMNMFGPYTKNFEELLEARVAIKHKEFDRAKQMLGGILSKYLKSENQADALSYALKIIINIVYGLTSAKFDNKFKDPRNKDNIVAKRGALFMIDLKRAVQAEGFTVAHIKTDSIKIPNANQYIVKFVTEFAQKYGYTFEHEATYEKFCLVNDAVYIAKYDEQGLRGKGGKEAKKWTATGAQFAHPYVFKRLFGKDQILFEDMCEAKTVATALYLDMNEGLQAEEHDYHFVGKAGNFCPVKPGCGGGILLREKDGKYYAATGTKGYRWLEAEMVKDLNRMEDIDRSYFEDLAESAVDNVSKFGDFEWFIADDSTLTHSAGDIPPWLPPCGGLEQIYDCRKCHRFYQDGETITCEHGYDLSNALLDGIKTTDEHIQAAFEKLSNAYSETLRSEILKGENNG